MLRIVQLTDAAAARAYYAASDYYLGGQELPGVWGGRGAEALGLAGEVNDRLAFDRLLDNLRPDDGGRLTAHTKGNRRCGWDFNFHAPKSVTLAYELRKDDRVLDAFRDAVDAAMAEVERDMMTRVRKGGADEDRVTGNAVWAGFVHRTARPVGGEPDPHLHCHTVVFNATRDPVEGKWKAAQIGELKRHAGFYEAVFHARLAENMTRLGFGVRRTGGKGWEVAGLDDPLLAKFSRRTALINQQAEDDGITNPVRKAELGLKTREGKAAHLDAGQLRKRWIGRLTEAEKAQLRTLGRVKPALPSVEESARFALAHGLDREAVVPEKKLLEHGLRHGLGRATLPGLRAALPRLGMVTAGGEATTREMLALESGLVAFAAGGRGAVRPLYADAEAWALVAGTPRKTNAGQREAARRMLTSTSRVALVVGDAGVGKTTTSLQLAADAIRAAGVPFRGVANTHTAKDEMREIDPGAMTLAGFLGSEKAQNQVRRGVILLDEAGMVGHRDLARLFDTLERIDARAILCGDHKQHGAVAAGGSFKLLQDHAGLRPARITEIVRQTDDEYRGMVALLAAGKAAEAFDYADARGWVRPLAELLPDHAAAVDGNREVLVVDPTHKSGGRVTAELRAWRKETGRVAAEERHIPVLVNLNWTDAERAEARRKGSAEAERVRADGLVVRRYGVYRPGTLAVAVGDELRATGGFQDANGNAVRNGSRFTVRGFRRAGIEVVTPAGGVKVIPLDARHLAHDLVVTSHKSQGRTAKGLVQVVGSADSLGGTGMEELYVAASRAKRAVRIYTDDKDALRAAVQRSQAKRNATDLFGPAATPAAKPPGLAARLSARAARVVRLRPPPVPIRPAPRRPERGFAYGG